MAGRRTPKTSPCIRLFSLRVLFISIRGRKGGAEFFITPHQRLKLVSNWNRAYNSDPQGRHTPMDNLEQSETFNDSTDPSVAPTQKLPKFVPHAEQDDPNFQAGQNQILKMIAANAPLSNVLNRIVNLIEEQSPGMFCSVLLLSADGNHIEHGAAPSLAPHYVKAVNGSPIGPKQGSCGTAMYRGTPVVVTDIFTDPLWEDYRDLAASSGLRACWSTPILSTLGKVLGSFAMYYAEPRTPTGDETRLTEVATYLARLAIQYHKA